MNKFRFGFVKKSCFNLDKKKTSTLYILLYNQLTHVVTFFLPWY